MLLDQVGDWLGEDFVHVVFCEALKLHPNRQPALRGVQWFELSDRYGRVRDMVP